MSATALGTTGNFGIATDQTGIVLHELSFDYSAQEKNFLNKSGEIIGMTRYQEKIDIKLGGLVPSSAAFSGKISAALTLANAAPAHLQASSSGTTICMKLSRAQNNEDWEKIDIEATNFPYITLGA